MRGQLRDYDFLARYAGDEFVALVPETDSDSIGEFCQRIEKAVAEFALPVAEGKSASVGVSLGAACYPKDGETLDQILIAADKAMYISKAFRKQELATAKPSQSPAPIKPLIESCEEITTDDFIVELDESHIVSNAIN